MILGSEARGQGGSDGCAAAVAIAGAGPFTFDNTAATTGAEGQGNASCLASGQTGISNDVWFAWTAATTGDLTLSLCGGTGIDTKVAVYAGGACPGGAPLACNDNLCGVQSKATFAATAGTLYTIQLGNSPGAAAGQGSFTIAPAVPPEWDRSIENVSVSLLPGSTSLYQIEYTTTIAKNYTLAIGADLSMSVKAYLNGAPVPIATDSPTIIMQGECAGIPTDCATSEGCTTGDCCSMFFVDGVPSLHPGKCGTSITGACLCGAGLYLVNTGPFPLQAGDWIDVAITAAPTALPETDASNDTYTLVVPSEMVPLCSPGADGVVPCPCGNPPAGPNRGCDNSSATGGASLSSSGLASLSLDSLVFTTIDQKPTGTSVVLQGSAYSPTGVLFGAGVRCAAGSLKRLYIKNATAGSITAPTAGDPSVSARSAALGDPLAPGAQRWYQVYYRDPAPGFCGPLNTFNVTQAGAISWLP